MAEINIAIDLPGRVSSNMLGAPPHGQTVADSTTIIKATLETLGKAARLWPRR